MLVLSSLRSERPPSYGSFQPAIMWTGSRMGVARSCVERPSEAVGYGVKVSAAATKS